MSGSNANPPHLIRIDNLDLLRAGAISLVLLFHLTSFVHWPDGVPLHLVQGWWSGVDLFFVLSGYLIGGLFWAELQAEGTVLVGRFMARRLLRTIPPYLVALHLIYLSRLFEGRPAGYEWTYLLFLQNYLGMPIFSVSWSLCIEEHFYLAAPLLLLMLAKAGRPAWILALFPVPLVSRLLTADPTAIPFGPHYYETHNHFEGLVLGVWLSWLRFATPVAWDRLGRLARPALPLVAALILSFGLFRSSLAFDNLFAYTVLALGFGLLLFGLVSAPPLALAKTKGVKWLARAAFSLYLTHTYVLAGFKIHLLPHLSGSHVALQSALALATALAAGYAFYRLVERPVLLLRDRVTGGRAQSQVTLQPSR